MLRLCLVAFELKRKERKITTKDANKFYRKLYGYKNWSCYSRYQTFVKGFIHRINAVRISKSTILVPEENLNQLKQYLLSNQAISTVVTADLFMEKKNYEQLKKC
jgi:hypothetical protein